MENIIIVEVKVYSKHRQERVAVAAETVSDEELDKICNMTSSEIFDAIKTKPVPCSWSNEMH